MALTPAERQARYREKHGDEKKSLRVVLDTDTRKRLDRIARHREVSVTVLISQWAEKDEARILSRMTAKTKKEYFA